MLTLLRPLVTIDIEATGTDPVYDRILVFAAKKLNPDNSWVEMRSWNFNGGGVHMDDEVIAIHGITNEMAAAEPPFTKEAGEQILHFLNGCDIGGFNLSGIDLPMLWEELYRVGIEWDTEGINFVDAGSLFKKCEPRDLTAAVKFYCNRDRKGAHDALADVDETLAVLLAQHDHYAETADMSLAEFAEFSHFEPKVDLAGKIVRNKDGVPCYAFGKSKGVPVLDDVGFAEWMLYKATFPTQTCKVLRKILNEPDPDFDPDEAAQGLF